MRIDGTRLRELRTRKGMTQTQIAAALQCSRGAVSTWETTGGLPRPERLRKLADFLGVPVSELIEGETSPTLRELRAFAGLRQRDVSVLLKVGPSTYCDVETGRQNLPPRWVPILSEAFDVPAEKLTSLSSPEETSSVGVQGKDSLHPHSFK